MRVIGTFEKSRVLETRIPLFYMAGSMSRQGEPNPVLSLDTRAGKMVQLACSGLAAVSRKKIVFFSCNYRLPPSMLGSRAEIYITNRNNCIFLN